MHETMALPPLSRVSRLAVFTKNMDTRMGVHIFGGEGGIRTLEPFWGYTISNRAPSTGLGDFSVRSSVRFSQGAMPL